jgi:uncharacterized protein with HEPN domain
MYERTDLQFVQEEVVLDIVQQKLPDLKVQVDKIIMLENESIKVIS